MVKKKRPQAPADPATVAQLTARKIAAMLGDFLKKTGHIIVAIKVDAMAEPGPKGTAITQTVQLNYGVPQQEKATGGGIGS